MRFLKKPKPKLCRFHEDARHTRFSEAEAASVWDVSAFSTYFAGVLSLRVSIFQPYENADKVNPIAY